MTTKQSNINLYHIPSRLTKILIHMDVSIFELLKTRINYKFSNYLFGNGDKKV